MSDGDLTQLRRYTTFVLLSLLAFVVVGNYIDDIALGNRFTIDTAFYTLVAGLVGGMFSAEVIRAFRERNKNGSG